MQPAGEKILPNKTLNDRTLLGLSINMVSRIKATEMSNSRGRER